MPIYSYRCKDCKGQFEESRPMCYRNCPSRCKECGGEAELQISKTSFALKGGGWAKDGYGDSFKGGKK